MNINQESQVSNEFSGEQVRPWVRYWAKMIDLLVFGFIFGFLLVLIIIVTGIDLSYIFEFPDYLLTIFIMFLYLFFEPFLLSTWGTTLGRFLLKVKVRNRDGSKLSYKDGFIRTATVWFRGLGLSIPLVSLVTLAVAHGKLVDNHVTSWDKDGDFVVTHRTIGLLRVFLLLVPVFLAIYFIIFPMKLINMEEELNKVVKEVNPKLPRMIDTVTRQDSVSVNNLTLTYHYTILDSKDTNISEEQGKAFAEQLYPIIKNQMCSNKSIVYMIKQNVVFKHLYVYEGTDVKSLVVIDSCE